MPRRHYADRLTYAEEAKLRAELADERRRSLALSRRLDLFMAGPWWRRVWVAIWRGTPPVFSVKVKRVA